jgi:hypothetical protein
MIPDTNILTKETVNSTRAGSVSLGGWLGSQTIPFVYLMQPPKKYTFEMPAVKRLTEVWCIGKTLNLWRKKCVSVPMPILQRGSRLNAHSTPWQRSQVRVLPLALVCRCSSAGRALPCLIT